jgi:hypothetical protein
VAAARASLRDSAVHRCRRRGGELAGEVTDLVGGHAAMDGDGLRREIGGKGADLVDTLDVGGHSPEIDEGFVEQHMHDGQQQRSIGAWAGSEVTVGEFGRAGAGRVDDDEPTAPLAQRPQLAWKVRGGRQTAIGDKGIRANDDQVVSAVKIGNRESDGAAEHETEGDVLGHLVQRARAEHLMGAEPADDHGGIQGACNRMRVRVAKINAH